MIENLNFLVAPLLLALFGLPAGFASSTRRESKAFRFSLMFLTGTVVFVVWETILAILGVAWSISSVVAPLGISSVVATAVLWRRGVGEEPRVSSSTGWDWLALLIAAGGLAHLVFSAATARATSIDFFYFWSVKGIRFAEASGFDTKYLASMFSVHAHTTYPPLVPLITAWGADLVGYVPWRAALVSMAMWIVLAYPIVLRGLRSRLPVGEATLASGVWLIGMSLAVTSSASAGNAEPPLVFFATIAIVALVADDAFPGWVAPIAVSGLVLTKSEGVVLWTLLVAGAGLRDLLEQRAVIETAKRLSGIVVAPTLALGTWIAFELQNGLAITDPAREAVGEMSLSRFGPALVEMARCLDAGSGWLAWSLVIVVLGLSWRSWKTVTPAILVMTGILGFLLVYYLHYQGDFFGKWVSWTLPRVSLTALSAGLVASAMGSGGRESGMLPDGQSPEG